MGSGHAGKGMGNQKTTGHQNPINTDEDLSFDDAARVQGLNRLQANDQRRGHNQRETMPGETDRTEGVVESFERMDPRKRVGG